MPMKKTLCIILLSMTIGSALTAQTRFRSGIFLHHSTGLCIWGPNGSATSVPQQMDAYNAGHGYHGDDSVRMDQQWFPGSVDNEWSTWHAIFETDSPENVSGYFAGNRIIMIKSCFPSSDLNGTGQPADTASPTIKTIFNYKWHWRHIVAVMRSHPDNFFVIWTNAPLEINATDSTAARLANRFCHWANDTLAAGLDPMFGAFPVNVHVFDFFHMLADTVGFLKIEYRSGDSHPNAAATALVAPLLATELFDAAIAYEQVYNGVTGGDHPAASGSIQAIQMLGIRPNPFTRQTAINYQLPAAGPVTIQILDIMGRAIRTVLEQYQAAGRHLVDWDGRDGNGRRAAGGVYLVRLQTNVSYVTRKIIFVK